MAYLEIKNISICYGKFHAIRDLSISIERGELFTFLGPSGSGKTTILLCLAGFLKPKCGRILLNERDITCLSPNRRNLGMVFQAYALFPHKTVFENIAYPLRVRKNTKAEIEQRVSEMLGMVRLGGLRARMPHQLSGGQQQRVALARALVFDPRLLLLDEPLGALDKKLREEMQFEIRHIQRESKATALYVTHDQKEAMAISDRIAILRDGGIEQVGTPMEVYRDPVNEFVADFIGGASFIGVRVDSINEVTCDVEWDGHVIEGIPKPKWLTEVGGSFTLMIRPEHIRIKAGKSSAKNEMPCIIQESYCLGETVQIRCLLRDGTVLKAREPYLSGTGFLPGDSAVLTVKSEETRLFAVQG